MKCKRCGRDFDIDEARETFNYFFENEEDYDEYYTKRDRMCGTCAIWEVHVDMTGEEPDYDSVW